MLFILLKNTCLLTLFGRGERNLFSLSWAGITCRSPFLSKFEFRVFLLPEGGGSCGVLDNLLNGNIVVIKFEIQSRYYVYFQINTPEKGMNLLIFSTMAYTVPLLFFYKSEFGITKVVMPLNKRTKPTK